MDRAQTTGFPGIDGQEAKSREQFSVAAAVAILSVTPHDALLLMATNPDSLMPYLKANLAGQALHGGDYQRICRIIRHFALHPDLMIPTTARGIAQLAAL